MIQLGTSMPTLVKVRMDQRLHPTFYIGCNYLAGLGLSLNMLVKGVFKHFNFGNATQNCK